jgi:hypothetical protein
MNKKEAIIGVIVLILVLFMGSTMLASNTLFFRLLAGMGLGYALTRSSMGFAGSVNRAYRTGSTRLLRVLMLMFVVTCVASVAFLFNGTAGYSLWINPINAGLILGGLSFGFGMTFSVCCASGVLTDLVTGLPRAFITLIFFGMGVFLGFPLQASKTWITDSWFTSASYANGVFMPDLFVNDGLNGYLGATILTIVFALIVTALAYKYEGNRKKNNTYSGCGSELEQYAIVDRDSTDKNYTVSLFSEEGYKKLFVTPWTMEAGAGVITGIFILLMGITKAGWGASTPYGLWFGRLLVAVGVSPETVSDFSTKSLKAFCGPFFEHAVSVQNVGIVLGTLICLLLAGNFVKVFTSELKITPKAAALYAMGGLFMGFGTRLANGCNVGALYTPIANFSLSGWIFLVFLVLGGVIGNKAAEKIGE